MIRIKICVCLMFMLPFISIAQQTYKCTIKLPGNLKAQSIEVRFFDGIEEKDIKKDSAASSISFSGKLHSLYGSLLISYPGDSIHDQFFKEFFVKPGAENKIKLKWNKRQIAIETEHARNIEKMGMAELKAYTEKETKDLSQFYKDHQAEFGSNDSLVNIAFEKAKIVGRKRYEFIKNNPSLFLSFRLFNREVIRSEAFPADSLLLTYYSIFPGTFKSTDEGAEIVKTLNAKIRQKDFLEAYDFKANDIYGKEISLRQSEDSIVLLNFWASWCVPCIKEVVQLKKIEQEYAGKKIKIISISIDTDSAAFTKAIRKYNMTWTHIFSGLQILQMYGPIAIPQLYMISKGRIIYSSQQQPDEHLEKLRGVLNEAIK